MEQNNIKFSVVIPTFNRGHLIYTAIESVLNQEYPNFEVLIVDDGSTDNTEEVVKKISDQRLKYFKVPNAERGAARNFGINKSDGDYINFLDSDDQFLGNHLFIGKKMVEENSFPECFHLGYNIKTKNGFIEKEVNRLNGNINEQLVTKGNFLSCNGIFLRRDIAKTEQFLEDRDLAGSEDYELWLRISSKHKIHYNNTITSTILDHECRSVLSINEERLIKRILLFLKYTSEHKNKLLMLHRKKFYSGAFSYISLHLVLNGGSKKLSLIYLLKGIKSYPLFVLSRRFFAIIKRLIISF